MAKKKSAKGQQVVFNTKVTVDREEGGNPHVIYPGMPYTTVPDSHGCGLDNLSKVIRKDVLEAASKISQPEVISDSNTTDEQ